MEIDYGHHRQNMPHDSDLHDDVDDTDFYAELTRQILLLTAEEDEDGDEDHVVLVPPKNGYSDGRRTAESTLVKSVHGFDFNYSVFAGQDYFRWSERESSANHSDSSAPAAVPNWLESLWGGSAGGSAGGGTGVFIPRASSRRHRPRRKNNGRRSNKYSGRVEQ